MVAVGGEDDGVEAGDGDGVAGMDDAARFTLDGFEVGGIVVARDVRVFAVGAVIEEFADGDALDELGDAADVIDVEVSDEHMIEFGDSGVAHGELDAGGVTAIWRGPAGVDQEGCAGRGNQQRGLAAFHIDGVDQQVLCRRCLCRGWLRLGQDKQDKAAEGQPKGGEDDSEARWATQGDWAEIGGDSHLGDSVAGLRVNGQKSRCGLGWCKLIWTLKPTPPSRLDCVGTWLSLVEHSLGVRGVGSSNLPVPTIYSAWQ